MNWDLKSEKESQAEHVGVDRNVSGSGNGMCKGAELGKNLAPSETVADQDD